jgi:hypothetical protein
VNFVSSYARHVHKILSLTKLSEIAGTVKIVLIYGQGKGNYIMLVSTFGRQILGVVSEGTQVGDINLM